MLHGLDAELLKDLAVRADQLWLTRPLGGAAAVAALNGEEMSGCGGGGGFSQEDFVFWGGFRGGWRGRGTRGGSKQFSNGKNS